MPTEREREDTTQLYEWVAARDHHLEKLADRLDTFLAGSLQNVPSDLITPAASAFGAVVSQERYLVATPAPNFRSMTLKEFVDYRALLFQKQYVLRNQEKVLDLLFIAFHQMLNGLFELPTTEKHSPFTIPLIYALPDPKASVSTALLAAMTTEYQERNLLQPLVHQLSSNLHRASGRGPRDTKSTKPLKFPMDSDLPLSELVDTYLGGTPLQALYKLPIPLKVTHEDRFNHMHIVGGTGAGKTTLIEWLIVHDLIKKDHPSLVIVDPHGDLISRLTHADMDMTDDIVLISPRDTQFPVAINPFAVNRRRHATYDATTREQVSAGVIQTLDYLFSNLFDLKLTGKQAGFFRYIIRLLLTLPEVRGTNATILDMLALMKDASQYQDVVAALPPIPREFFEVDFRSKTYTETRDQIRYRLQSLIENPTLARMFTSPETKVDFFEEMNRGKIILIDTAADFLKDASPTFGRIMISLVLQAVRERAAIPERDRKPAFLIVDEAASFFDSNIDDLLTDARKYKVGCVFAHQYLDQASHALRASLAANTGSKFASGLSSSDARSMAADMRTTPDFILGQPKLQFAAHFRNITPHAVSIPMKPGFFDRLGKLSEADYQKFVDANRKRVSILASDPPPEPFSNPIGFGKPQKQQEGEEPRRNVGFVFPHKPGVEEEDPSYEW